MCLKVPPWQSPVPITAAVFYIAVLISAIHCALHLIAQCLELEPLPSTPAGPDSGHDRGEEVRP